MFSLNSLKCEFPATSVLKLLFRDFHLRLPQKIILIQSPSSSSVFSVLFSGTFFILLQITTQPTFRRQINVVSTLWINENERKPDVGFSTFQNVDTMSVSDVETTLKQRWYNFISTLFQRVVNISKSYIKTSRASDKYGFIYLQIDN